MAVKIYMLFVKWVRSILGKTVCEVVRKTEGEVFANMDRLMPANNVFSHPSEICLRTSFEYQLMS